MECRSWQLQPMVILELVFSSTHPFVLLYVAHESQPATLGVCGLSNCLNLGLREKQIQFYWMVTSASLSSFVHLSFETCGSLELD